ncbi:MAG TPA: hypothetical protein VMG59_04570 [Phycisphaerae bacterium]|nr:hypothetical protein [Phycisphaerae bacterium]
MKYRNYSCALLLALLACAASGCSHQALSRATFEQNSTVNDIQYTEILQNLALFSKSPTALPWAVGMVSGEVTVTDELKTIGASRRWEQFWGIQPITDPRLLLKLQRLYQWQFGYYADNGGYGQLHDYATDKDPLHWQAYQHELANDLVSGLSPPFPARNVLDLLPLPGSGKPWFTFGLNVESTVNSFYSTQYGVVWIYVNNDLNNIEMLSKFSLFVLRLKASTSQNVNYTIQNDAELEKTESQTFDQP